MRFSGKKSGKRVRLVCRLSTSVSAKSVFTVSEARRFEPSRFVTSRLGSATKSVRAPGAGLSKPVTNEGRTERPQPRSKRGSPASSPARLVCVTS